MMGSREDDLTSLVGRSEDAIQRGIGGHLQQSINIYFILMVRLNKGKYHRSHH